jgi:biopolymer transport protein ExbD
MISRPWPSKGIFVNWRKPEAVVWEKSPWPETLEVYVSYPTRFFVNGQEVQRNELHDKLIDRLSRRAEWTVYFEANPDVSYMDAVYVMDTVQKCGARLVWVTPKMRKAWQQNSEGPEPASRKALPL